MSTTSTPSQPSNPAAYVIETCSRWTTAYHRGHPISTARYPSRPEAEEAIRALTEAGTLADLSVRVMPA